MIRNRIAVLQLDPSAESASRVSEMLRGPIGWAFSHSHVTSMRDAIQFIEGRTPDAILLAWPDETEAIDALMELRERCPEAAILLVLDNDDFEIATKALRLGAQDVLQVGEIRGPELSRSLVFSCERQRVQEKTKALTLEDELTGLYNQRGFYTLAAEYARIARETSKGMVILFIDLDGLKAINDRYGHTEGSRAIIAAGGVLETTFRETDLIARWGGDEFAVLLMETEETGREQILDRLNSVLMRFNTKMRRGYDLAMSVGFARFNPEDPRPVEVLIKEADENMYKEKRSRKVARED